MPSGLLQDLVTFAAGQGHEFFRGVFGPVLQGLLRDIRSMSLDSERYKEPLTLLAELCELKVNNVRPVCLLVRSVLSN